MIQQICDFSRENISYGIRSNGWTRGKLTSLLTGSQWGRKKNPAGTEKKNPRIALPLVTISLSTLPAHPRPHLASSH